MMPFYGLVRAIPMKLLGLVLLVLSMVAMLGLDDDCSAVGTSSIRSHASIRGVYVLGIALIGTSMSTSMISSSESMYLVLCSSVCI
jgi:hypothetical protein